MDIYWKQAFLQNKLMNFLVLTIFNEEVYLTFKSIFHKDLNLF